MVFAGEVKAVPGHFRVANGSFRGEASSLARTSGAKSRFVRTWGRGLRLAPGREPTPHQSQHLAGRHAEGGELSGLGAGRGRGQGVFDFLFVGIERDAQFEISSMNASVAKSRVFQTRRLAIAFHR